MIFFIRAVVVCPVKLSYLCPSFEKKKPGSVVQGIVCRFPEPEIQVRVLAGLPSKLGILPGFFLSRQEEKFIPHLLGAGSLGGATQKAWHFARLFLLFV